MRRDWFYAFTLHLPWKSLLLQCIDFFSDPMPIIIFFSSTSFSFIKLVWCCGDNANDFSYLVIFVLRHWWDVGHCSHKILLLSALLIISRSKFFFSKWGLRSVLNTPAEPIVNRNNLLSITTLTDATLNVRPLDDAQFEYFI